MSHYYITDDKLGTNKKLIRYTYKNTDVNFYSDLGVFSKERVDFGTNVLLNAIEIGDNIKSILDVGCGYGVMGISFAKKYPEKNIYMVDINKRCVELTNSNILLNSLKNASCIESDLYENINDCYDLIVSNPPIRAGKNVVNKVITDAYEHINYGGAICVVIQKKQGAPSLVKKMEEVFGNVEIVSKEKGYFILKSTKK